MTTSLFAERFWRKKVERKVKEKAGQLAAGLSIDDLEYAAENNLDVITRLLKPEERKSRRKGIAPFKIMLEQISVDDFLRLFEEVSPEHGAVLRRHRAWLIHQLEITKEDLLG